MLLYNIGKRKGFFLAFALWLFLLLSLFCLGLGFRTFFEIRKTKLLLNRARATDLAIAGVKYARKVLGADEDTSVDHLQEEWAVEIEETDEHEEGIIIKEFAKGYKSQQRTIRPAKVKVSKKIEQAKDLEDSEKEEKAKN